MAEKESMALTFYHKHIKENPSTCGKIVTKQLLNTSRKLKPPKRARNSQHNLVEQKEEKERERG